MNINGNSIHINDNFNSKPFQIQGTELREQLKSLSNSENSTEKRDQIQLSNLGELAAATLTYYDTERLSNTFNYSHDVVKDFADDYAIHFNNINEICDEDEGKSANRKELLAQLDKQANNIVDHFADNYLAKLERIEKFAHKDKGESAYQLSEKEKSSIKSDYKRMFKNAIQHVKQHGNTEGLTDEKIQQGTKMIADDINDFEFKYGDLEAEIRLNALHEQINAYNLKHNAKWLQSGSDMKEKHDTFMKRHAEYIKDHSVLNLSGSDFIKQIFKNFIKMGK